MAIGIRRRKFIALLDGATSLVWPWLRAESKQER